MHSRRLKIFLILCILLAVLAGCTATSSVTITFDSMGGTKIAPRTIFPDTTSLELPPDPKKDGYVFDGWFYTADHLIKVDPKVIPTESTTFFAKWIAKAITITFLDDNGIEIGTMDVDYGSTISYTDLPTPPEKEGYVGEWYTENDTKVNASTLSNIKAAMTLKAFYTQKKVSIKYFIGDQVKEYQGLPGQDAPLVENPQKASFSFIGWYYDKLFTNKCINPPSKFPNQDILLYANFIDVSEMYKYLTYSDVTIGSETGICINGLTALGKNQATIAIPSKIGDKKVLSIGREYAGGAAESYRVLSSNYLTSIIIPETVISIGSFAFAQNTKLTTVTINMDETDKTYKLSSIGTGAFAGCTSLKEISIPDSVATIGSYAFAGITKTKPAESEGAKAQVYGNEEWTSLDTWYLTDMSLDNLYISENSILTNLKSYAFYNTTNLKSISLPKSLTHIDYTMFDGSSFENISLYKGNTDLINIDNAIYSRDGTTLFYYPIYGNANFVLDSRTVKIEPYAFYNNQTLLSVDFNNLLEEVGEHAFENAKSLSSVNIDSNSQLSYIGAYAFASCTSLTSVKFPRNLNTLGEGAFKDCVNITNITFDGNSLNSIPAHAFDNCKNLVIISIQSNVRSIGDFAFYNCINLTDIDIDTELSIMDSIGSYAFANCVSLALNNLPSGLKIINSYAFAGVDNAMKVNVNLANTQLTSIGEYAFFNNNRLDRVTFPQTLLTLGEGVFENCTNINTLSINTATSLVELPNRLFYNCINIRNNVVNFPASVVRVGDYAFFNCKSLINVALNNVNSIGKSAFENCINLREGSNVNQYILPAFLVTLGERAFANCQSLTSIHISNTLKAISKEAFINCTSLQDITYNTDYILETIGENSFANCTSLTTFNIPSTLLPRGENQGFINNPFYGCANLLKFTFYDGNINNLVVMDDIVFEKTTEFEGRQVYSIYAYPTGRGSIYEVATNVSYINDYAFYGSRIASLIFTASTPEDTRELITLVKIGDYAFANCDLLTSVHLSKRVYEVGDYAFNNCKLLSDLTIDATYAADGETASAAGVSYVVTNLGQNPNNNNLMTIGKHAFAKIAIAALEIAPRIININEYAFSDCYNLLNINFVDSFDTNLLTIGDYAFYANNGLTSLVLPIQLKSIGDYAFAYCVNIKDITFNTSVNANGGEQVKLNIGAYAFSNNHFLHKINLPASLDSMGEGIFSYASRLKYVNFASELNLSRTSIAIPKYAFLGDAAIEKIIIPYYITSIGDSAFYELSINEIVFLSSALEEGLALGDYAFANLKLLKSIDLPNRLTSIGNNTFSNSEISNLTYNSGSSFTVGDYAFSNIKITEINITQRITYLGKGCFSNNTLLVTVNYFGHNDLIIADETYSNSTLREISFDGVPHNVTIGKSAFENTPALAVVSLSGNGTTLEATNKITIGEKAFYNSAINKVTIKSPTIEIASYAFNNTKLKSFEISDTETVISIGYLAIANNLDLTSLKITTTVSIEHLDYGFASYNPRLSLIELVDPSKKYNSSNGVVYFGTTLLVYPAGKVGSTYTAVNGEYILTTQDPDDMQDNFGIYYTFDGENYTQLTSSANWVDNTYYTRAVKNIAPHAFAGNTHIRNLILDSGNAVVKKDATSFVQNSQSLTFFVPANLVNSYINDWAVNNVTYISVNLNGMVLKLLVSGRYAVEKYTGLDTDIVINSKIIDGDKVYNVVAIADNAFNQNISIRKVTLGAGIEKVGKYAFYNCTSLETFISGSMLTVIDTSAFQNCVNLKNIDLNEGLITIERFAFENCITLESIVLPHSLQTLGHHSFANCRSLNDIDLGQGLKYIMDNSFENCLSLVSISIPESVREINSYAFANCAKLSYVYVNSTSVPNLKKNGFAKTLDGIRILVPNHLLFGFQSTINWREYSSKMLPIEYICQEQGYEKYIIERISGNNYRLVGYLGSEEELTIHSEISQQIIITEIGSYAINHFAKDVTLAEGIIFLNNYAFYNAKSLNSITLPSTLIGIGDYAFANVDTLKDVEVRDFVDEQIVVPLLAKIGAYAFYNTAITSIVIPEKVTSIGDYAFSASKESYLTKITFQMKDPENTSLPFGKLKIGKFAFMNNIYLKQIVFDCYVDTIGEGAFNNCTSLRNIYFNSTRLDAQGKATKTLSDKTIFANCDNLSIFVRLTTILNNFRSVWQNDSDKSKLYLAGNVARDTENMVIYTYDSGQQQIVDTFNYFVLEIPQGSTSVAYIKNYIGEYTGRYIDQKNPQVGDKTDTDIKIPSTITIGGDQIYTITQISAYAFNNKITSVIIPDSVEVISSYAFYNATSLKSVTFSSSSKLTTISNSAFENCTSLSSFHVPSSVKNIGEKAFKNCSSLSSVTFAEKEYPTELDTLEFGKFVFENCVALTSINVPNHAISMGEGIFKGAIKLENVNFNITKSKITTINTYAFQKTAIRSIKFPQSLQNVGDYAFDSCLNLTSVYLTKTSSPPTATGNNVFNNIPNPFIRIYVPYENYQNYSRLAGWNSRSVLADQKDDNNKFNYILTGPKNSETAIITNYLGTSTTLFVDSELEIGGLFYRVSAISSYAGNTKITKVEFAETSYLTTLSDYAFANCTSLREIRLPNSVTNIGKNAFYGCTKLTDVTLPSGINRVEERTFFGCTSLKEITLPSNVLTLGEAAFGMCSNLNRIIVEMEGTTIATLGSGAFTGVSKHFVIVVPTQSKIAFVNEWYQYEAVIFARNEMYGDYIISEGVNSIEIVQYNGYTDGLNFDEITIKGKKIVGVNENAFVDETLKYMIAGEWRRNGKIL